MIPQRINRAQWIRGRGHGQVNRLMEADGTGCIFGLCLFDADVPIGWLMAHTTPYQVQQRYRLPVDWQWLLRDELGYGWMTTQSDDAAECMIYNDRAGMDEAEREAALIAIFARNGVELEFYDA